jgi:glutamate racemase
MSDNCRPIGFFDSGVGGISVLKTVFNIMPFENYIYYGDNANAPYGERSESEIKELSLAAGRFLFEKGVKAIVIACNTATSAAVNQMREDFNIPVISMEPAVRPALTEVRDGKILVLATAATVSQERYLKLLEKLKAEDKVVSVGCSGLVEMIEDGKTSQKELDTYFDKMLSNIKDLKIDAAVIGCTHYSFIHKEIKNYIDRAFDTDCLIYDGKEGTSYHLRRVLEENNILCSNSGKGSVQFFTSGQKKHLLKFKELFDNYHP